MDRVEFLLARVAEDGAAARRASDEVARLDDAFEVEDPNWRRWSRPFASASSSGPVAEFVDRQTPARVLADCEAKRRILEAAREAFAKPGDDPDDGMADLVYEEVLDLLALPYSDHADYRKWKA